VATPETIINLETSLIAARAAAAETISVYKAETNPRNSNYWGTLRVNAKALQDRVEDLMRVIGYPHMDANCRQPAAVIIEGLLRVVTGTAFKERERLLEEARNFLKGR
jgi:hypothetical protein